MTNDNFHIFVDSRVNLYPYGVAPISPQIVNYFVNNSLGVFLFTSVVVLPLYLIAVLYYLTAEIRNATPIYTKKIKDEKSTLLNDNCLTPVCIIVTESKTIIQGIETFSDSNSFRLQRLNKAINSHNYICRERVVMFKY